MKKVLTLVLVLKDNQVLLGMKKRGFGAGWWNGFGGKLNPGESVEDAAKRELLEEISVKAEEIRPRGILQFTFKKDPVTLEVHLFECTKYSGEPIESEEMLPQWFSYDGIPYDKMWPDDKYWLPKFLEGKDVNGIINFDENKNIINYELK